eukprot:Nk52_evm22s503 gene=Nk52_evmTU22s503
MLDVNQNLEDLYKVVAQDARDSDGLQGYALAGKTPLEGQILEPIYFKKDAMEAMKKNQQDIRLLELRRQDDEERWMMMIGILNAYAFGRYDGGENELENAEQEAITDSQEPCCSVSCLLPVFIMEISVVHCERENFQFQTLSFHGFHLGTPL